MLKYVPHYKLDGECENQDTYIMSPVRSLQSGLFLYAVIRSFTRV